MCSHNCLHVHMVDVFFFIFSLFFLQCFLDIIVICAFIVHCFALCWVQCERRTFLQLQQLFFYRFRFYIIRHHLYTGKVENYLVNNHFANYKQE